MSSRRLIACVSSSVKAGLSRSPLSCSLVWIPAYAGMTQRSWSRHESGVIVFPGSNCDRDVAVAIEPPPAQAQAMVWHGDGELPEADLIVLPGGFSYGDYLRCGAMAAHSPVMREVMKRARAGTPVLGICNGFQVLTEAGLLPGVLMRNATLKFICRDVHLAVEQTDTVYTQPLPARARWSASRSRMRRQLFRRRRHAAAAGRRRPRRLPLLRAERRRSPARANPNGSRSNIAGIFNETKTVLGLMPHPETPRRCRLRRHRRRQDVPLAGRDAALNIAARAAKAADEHHAGARRRARAQRRTNTSCC